MKNKNIILAIIAVIFVTALTAGAVFIIHNNCTDKTEETESSDDTAVSDTDDISHTTIDTVIEFDKGNEVYLDESIIPYLERMDKGVPAVDEDGNYYLYNNGDVVYDHSGEKKLEAVLDNIILLINHFTKEEYSMDAMHQIQRFYLEYHGRLDDVPFSELSTKIAKCFSKEGADPDTLNQTVIEVFGYNRGDECAFVFSPLTVAPIKVEFYNVKPKDIELTDSMRLLCIYDSWHNEEDDGYERNLEGWLHNIICSVKTENISDEKIVVAQIIYAGSIANAEYRSDWSDALIRCLSIDDWNYDSLKTSVEYEFGVSLDYNEPIKAYFDALAEAYR